MAKSLVLKDEKNRPGGYVLVCGQGLLCRAQIDGPSQLMLRFEDGTWKSYGLTSSGEQTLTIDARKLCGACVIRDNRVVLASSKIAEISCAMEIERQIQKQTPLRDTATPAPTKKKIEPDSENKGSEAKLKYVSACNTFAQRRWPPPPCLERARYIHGSWQEAETE